MNPARGLRNYNHKFSSQLYSKEANNNYFKTPPDAETHRHGMTSPYRNAN